MVVEMYGISSMGHRIARAIKHKTGCQRILIANTPLAVDGSYSKGAFTRHGQAPPGLLVWVHGVTPIAIDCASW